MKIQIENELISDLAKVADLPLVPAPGEASTELPKQDFIPQDLSGMMTAPIPGSTVNPPGDSRPSLEVAIENLANLTKHAEPFIGRLRAWDTRALSGTLEASFLVALNEFASSFVHLNDNLTAMKAYGYVAKTTPISRLRAKLQVGTKVKLAEKARIEFVEAGFTVEQMDSIQVARLGGTGAFLTTGDGTSLGLVRFSCIELV